MQTYSKKTKRKLITVNKGQHTLRNHETLLFWSCYWFKTSIIPRKHLVYYPTPLITKQCDYCHDSDVVSRDFSTLLKLNNRNYVSTTIETLVGRTRHNEAIACTNNAFSPTAQVLYFVRYFIFRILTRVLLIISRSVVTRGHERCSFQMYGLGTGVFNPARCETSRHCFLLRRI